MVYPLPVTLGHLQQNSCLHQALCNNCWLMKHRRWQRLQNFTLHSEHLCEFCVIWLTCCTTKPGRRQLEWWETEWQRAPFQGVQGIQGSPESRIVRGSRGGSRNLERGFSHWCANECPCTLESAWVKLNSSLTPRPHPLTRRKNSLVNRVKFLSLAHAFVTV